LLIKSLSEIEKSLKFITKINIQKLIIAEVVLVALITASYTMVRFAPRLNRLTYAQDNSSKDLNALEQHIQAARKELEELTKQHHTMENLVKRPNQMAQLMELVLKAATHSGLRCEALTPALSSQRKSGNFIATSVNASLKGSFIDFMQMLRAIETDKNRANVVEVVIRNNDVTYPLGSILMVVETYQPNAATVSGQKNTATTTNAL